MTKFLKSSFLPLLVIVFILVILIQTNFPLPFRYETKLSDKNVLFKTDRYTGKTWVVTTKGEIEVGSFPTPKPTIPIREFPIHLLRITQNEANNDYIHVSILNTANSPARGIKIKVAYLKSKSGPIFDTKYHELDQEIDGGDTVSYSIMNYHDDSWYSVYLDSATY